MPTLRTPTPDELKSLDAAGVDVSKLPPQLLFPDGGGFPSIPTQQSIGTGQTIADTLKAHLGGIGGGGAGALAGAGIGAAIPVADLTGIPEAAGAAIGGLIGMTGGGVAGGYAGQKLQQAIEPTDYYNQLQQQAQLAAEQNPKTALGTDIIGSALASGGKPSLDALRAGRGLIGKLAGNALSDTDKQALIGSVLNAGVNPAINTGINYATTGQLPSGSDLAAQVGGGLVFSRQADWAAKLLGTHGAVMSDEPKPEVSNQTLQLEDTEKPKQLAAPRRFFGDESGIIDIDAEPVPTKEPAPEVTNNPKLLPQVAGASNSGGQLTVAPEILQKVIDNGATKPVSVQRIFPKLNLSDNDAAEVLCQANLLAELHINNPANQTESENQNATGIRENQGLPSQSGQATQEGQAGSSGNLVDTSPRSQEQPIPQKSSGDTSQETKIVPAASTKDILPPSGDVVNSPLSDYNRYQILQQQAKESTSKGIYPSKEVQNEIEQLKNKYGGNPPPQFPENRVLMPLHIQQHIINGDATTGSVLQKLASTPDHPFAPLAKELFENGDKQSLATPWVHDNTLDQGGQRSHYSVGKGRVAIGTGSAGDSRVVMEEAIHSLTSNKIPNFTGRGAEHLAELQKYLKTGTNPHVKDLINSYLETAQKLGVHDKLFNDKPPTIIEGQRLVNPHDLGVANKPDEATKIGLPYAMGNLHEFIAQAMKDPQFQRTLDGIKTEDGRTVWQKIVDAVRNLLGLSPKAGSMLDRVLRSSGELVHQLPNPKVGERVAPPINTNIKERNGDFLLNARHLIDNPDKLGLKPNIHGAFNGTQLLGTLRNKLSKTEYDILKDAGIEKAFNGRIISQKEASEWIKNNSPKVEVRKFGASAMSVKQNEYSSLRHWYDTQSLDKRRVIDEAYDPIFGDEKPDAYLAKRGFDTTDQQRAARYNELGKDQEAQPSRSQSHWQSIAPKSEKAMPGYVEIAVVKAPTMPKENSARLEVLSEKGRNKRTTAENQEYEDLMNQDFKDKPKFSSSHNFPPNTLGFVRGYMETVKNPGLKWSDNSYSKPGDKIFHVIEVQSDWAQRVREVKEAQAKGMLGHQYTDEQVKNSNDPLLPHYERLALKAAIDHARSEGATKIAISDAETAMMTEGHDRGAELYSDTLKGLKVLQETRTDPGHRELTATGDYENRHGQTWIDVIAVNGDRLRLKVINKDGTLDSNNRPSNELNEWLDKPDGKYIIAQEPGMRLHYDQTLPKIAEELTGGKGEKMSFGTHKMAVEPSHHDPDQSDLIERKDLIFRNPDGSPKTDVSARAYDISHLPDREPMQYGKQFAAPKQEASAEDIRNLKTSATTTPKESNLPLGFNKIFRAGLDTIRSLAHPDAVHVADSLQNVFQTRENLLGKQLNPIIDTAKKYGITNKNIDGKVVENQLRKMRETGEIPTRKDFGNEGQYRLFNQIRQSLEENYKNRLAIHEPVIDNRGARLPERNPAYWPTTTNPKAAQILRDNTDTKAIKEIKDTFIKYQTEKLGLQESHAEKNWKDFNSAIQGTSINSDTANAIFTNSARKAEGYLLPPELTRPGILNNIEAYFHSQATDNAYYQHIENDSRTMAALGYTHDAWNNKVEPPKNGKIVGNTAVKNVVNELKGESEIGLQGRTIAKSESLATAGILGPLTEWHKVASNMFKALSGPESPATKAQAVYHAITHLSEGWTHAKQNGKIVMTAKSASDMWASGVTAADRLAALARGIRQIYTLNDLTEKFNLGALQSMSEIIVPAKIKAANDGSIAAQLTMKHIDPSWTKNKTYSPQEINQLASNLAGIIHGTRDARTLPSWMLHDNEISAFFKLSSWGIAQTNSFVRDVYTPALKGELAPLINAAFGGLVGGYILKEVREKLAGKKSQIPSLSEIAASDRGLSGNIPAIAYNMMAASSYAGFGGMISTFGRMPFDMAFKNQSQGATFPLDEYASDIATTAHQVGEAIANDPNINWLDLASHVAGHLMMTNFQLGRVALNQAINDGGITGSIAEKKELSDKMNQLRRFDMVEGLPYNDLDAGSNPYMNIEQKNFKMEQDLPTAIKELPGLVTNIIDTYKSNPDVMMNKLKALKENQYATFPSLETAPLSFYKYLGYLQREEGPQAAQDELMDYMKHKVTNEAKASVVP